MSGSQIFTRLTGMVAVLVLAITLTACSEYEEYQNQKQDRNHQAGEAWLSDHMSDAQINISGQWNSDDWGKGTFVQQGRMVQGRLGDDYDVKGVVSGDKAYLLLGSDGWYAYSIVLEMPAPNLLIGYSSHSVPYMTDGRDSIRLDRVQN